MTMIEEWARTAVADGGVTLNDKPSIVVQGETRKYLVYIDPEDNLTRCTCPAGKNGIVCKHTRAATLAVDEGVIRFEPPAHNLAKDVLPEGRLAYVKNIEPAWVEYGFAIPVPDGVAEEEIPDYAIEQAMEGHGHMSYGPEVDQTIESMDQEWEFQYTDHPKKD